jgi:5,10-methylenetetrahydromethanopterin reductase
MRFCLDFSHRAWTRGEPSERIAATVRLAKAADEAGFSSLWITEDPDGWDAFQVLALFARETQRIALGPGVTNPFLRHPNLIAASVATLDWISGGRAFLGLGRGQPEWYERALGIPKRSPLAQVEETVGLLRQLRREPHVASSPGPIAIHEWERTFAPVARPPIYLAATGPKMQELAGRVADGIRVNSLASLAYLRESVDRVRASAVASGRDSSTLRFFFDPGIRITDDPGPMLDELKGTIATIHALPGMDRQLRAPGLDVDGVMAKVRKAMRTNEILDQGGAFAEIRREGDLAAAKRAIPDELVRAVSAVGTVADVRRRLTDLAEIGITDVFFNIARSPGGIPALDETLAAIDPGPRD